MHTTKQNNFHKPHATHCEVCGRKLPNKTHHQKCAGCRKVAPQKEQAA